MKKGPKTTVKTQKTPKTPKNKKNKKTKKTCLPAELLCETSSSLLSTTVSRSQAPQTRATMAMKQLPHLCSPLQLCMHMDGGGGGGGGREGDNPGMMDMLCFIGCTHAQTKLVAFWLLDFIYNLPIDELQLITGKL